MRSDFFQILDTLFEFRLEATWNKPTAAGRYFDGSGPKHEIFKKVRGRQKGCRLRCSGTAGCRARHRAFLEPRSTQILDQKTTAWLRRIQVPAAPGSHHSLVNCIEISNFCQVKNPGPKIFPAGFLPKMDHDAAQKVNRAALHFWIVWLTIFGPALDHFLAKIWTDF